MKTVTTLFNMVTLNVTKEFDAKLGVWIVENQETGRSVYCPTEVMAEDEYFAMAEAV